VLVLTGAINLLNRAYGAIALGVRWVCRGTNLGTMVVTSVGGLVTHDSRAQLAVGLGIMGTLTILSWTNQIIRLLAANPIEARRNDDLVENPPEQLLAIQPISNLPNDDRDLVAPLVGLSASDLLVNARGEPGLAHALAHEVPSADSIDLLCAFVRWHGLRLLADQLEAHCRAGTRLRVITLLHCLHRLVKSLEVGARGRRGVEREVIAGGIARHPREVRCHTVVVSPHPVSGSIVAT